MCLYEYMYLAAFAHMNAKSTTVDSHEIATHPRVGAWVASFESSTTDGDDVRFLAART
jgi:hypothetical protein